MKNRILSRNQGYQKQVENLLSSLASYDDVTLNKRPPNGGWSVVQVMHHLIISEEQSLRYVHKKLSYKPKLNDAGFMEWFREQTLWFYLNIPIKFKAPPIVSDENLPEYATLADTKSRWLKIRQEWGVFIEQIPPKLVDKAVYRHPVVGRLAWSGLLTFFKTHFDRHIKQIRRTLRQTA